MIALQAPSPSNFPIGTPVASVDRTYRIPDGDGNTMQQNLRFDLTVGESRGSAASLEDAVRAAHSISRAQPWARPIYGVLQAADGYRIVDLVERYEGGEIPHSDLPLSMESPRTRFETVSGAHDALVALVGTAAWRDAKTNALHLLG